MCHQHDYVEDFAVDTDIFEVCRHDNNHGRYLNQIVLIDQRSPSENILFSKCRE